MTPNPTEAQTADRKALVALIESLEAEVQAGKELYWAIQGGLEHCPWCTSGGLQHTTECPVSKYLMVTAFRCRYCGGSWWEREEPRHVKWCPAVIAREALDG